MANKTKATTHKFYHVSTENGEDWAQELEPLPISRAKECMTCERKTGVFFRDCGPVWLQSDRLTIRQFSVTTQCYSCWRANDGPAFGVDRKGRTVMPYRATIMFAKNKSELAWLTKQWKNGQHLFKEVRTAFGDVVVFGVQKDSPGEDYFMKCPHCSMPIALTVATAAL